MITYYRFEGSRLRSYAPEDAGSAVPVWIDLLRPDPDDISYIDQKFDVQLPTLDEMREIELSSRLYEENGANYLTFIYVTDALGPNPETTPFTFVLKDKVLITIRYKEMRVITHLIEKCIGNGVEGPKTGLALMGNMIDAVIDLCADAIERGHHDIEEESRKTFASDNGDKDYKDVMKQIAGIGALNSKMRESLASLSRLLIFWGHLLKKYKAPDDILARQQTFAEDVQSLQDHAGFVSNKISFLLDATLGLVNIDQNAIIKFFSVAAVIFLPPTLIASIYGMNFRHMPELEWPFGYPMALILMVLSAILPYWYFKFRKWL